MSNPTVNTSFTAPDPNTEVSSLTGLVDELNNLVTTEIQGSYSPYVLGASTPSVSDQDKIWVQVDSAGRPLATKTFYNGTWRRVYAGKANEIAIFVGDPAVYFDATGLGIVGGDWDGWGIANGQNGTADWSDSFLCGAKLGQAGFGFSSGTNWQTNVTGTLLNRGGASNHTLVNNSLPNMNIQLAGKGDYDNNATPSSTKWPIVTGKWAGNSLNTVDVTTLGADPNGSPPVPQTAVPTVPPFIAVAWVTWLGYA